MKPLEQAINDVCFNCEKFQGDDCMKCDFPTSCPKVTQVLLDYNLKANEYKMGVRV